jgi:hypothetical protein
MFFFWPVDANSQLRKCLPSSWSLARVEVGTGYIDSGKRCVREIYIVPWYFDLFWDWLWKLVYYARYSCVYVYSVIPQLTVLAYFTSFEDKKLK